MWSYILAFVNYIFVFVINIGAFESSMFVFVNYILSIVNNIFP